MNGTNSQTGKALGGIDHLRQSITDILTTPVGTRAMRRDYGSDIYKLIDNPTNRETIIKIYAATVDAIGKWEPRINILKVTAASVAPGEIVLDMTGEYLPDGRVVTLQGIIVK